MALGPSGDQTFAQEGEGRVPTYRHFFFMSLVEILSPFFPIFLSHTLKEQRGRPHASVSNSFGQ